MTDNNRRTKKSNNLERIEHKPFLRFNIKYHSLIRDKSTEA